MLLRRQRRPYRRLYESRMIADNLLSTPVKGFEPYNGTPIWILSETIDINDDAAIIAAVKGAMTKYNLKFDNEFADEPDMTAVVRRGRGLAVVHDKCTEQYEGTDAVRVIAYCIDEERHGRLDNRNTCGVNIVPCNSRLSIDEEFGLDY